MNENPVLFVCGASARQVVSMAAAARIDCYAADLFGDFDTTQLARECVKVRRLEDVPEVAMRFDYDHCVLTGGMENHPDVVTAICRKLPARDRTAFVKCRDPFALQSIFDESTELSDLNVSFPETTRARPSAAQVGEWLLKQPNRSGGLGVKILTTTDGIAGGGQVYQRRVAGELVSGLFIADGQSAAVLGVSQQLAGCPELGSAEFVYCGSLAPLVLSKSQFEALQLTGRVLASEFGLCGVFGIDFVLDDGTLWLLEINPRITASAEVCQPLLPFNIVAEHVRALANSEFNSDDLPAYSNALSPPRFYGKAVVFNRQSRPLVISRDIHRPLGDWLTQKRSPAKTVSTIGDVPLPHCAIEPGSPVLTVMLNAQKKSAVETGLLQLADEVYQIIEA